MYIGNFYISVFELPTLICQNGKIYFNSLNFLQHVDFLNTDSVLVVLFSHLFSTGIFYFIFKNFKVSATGTFITA